VKDSTLGQRAAATAVWVTMKVKTKIGIGMKTKKKLTKKRILPVAKRDIFSTAIESSARWSEARQESQKL